MNRRRYSRYNTDTLTPSLLIAATMREERLLDLSGPDPVPGIIFVFGSNTAGIHGKGAALTAREFYGATIGVGVGLTGQAYAIPTKDNTLQPLSPFQIAGYVGRFIGYAEASERLDPKQKFLVTRIGTGLRALPDTVIAPMFADAPKNCILPVAWSAILFEIMPPDLYAPRQWHEREGKE